MGCEWHTAPDLLVRIAAGTTKLGGLNLRRTGHLRLLRAECRRGGCVLRRSDHCWTLGRHSVYHRWRIPRRRHVSEHNKGGREGMTALLVLFTVIPGSIGDLITAAGMKRHGEIR